MSTPYIVVATAIACAIPASAQITAAPAAAPPDTGTALTSDMLLLDRELLGQTIPQLERWGHSFYALSLYVADTAGPRRTYSYGLEDSPPINEPGAIADGLRSAMRLHFSQSPPGPRTVAIIVDSIAGPFNEAVDGIDGPQFPRMAITELEDKSGRCRRLERDYRFVKEQPGAGWGFGSIRYDAPRITRCEPRRFWPAEPVVEVPTRPRLAEPIVRPLSIDSFDNYFTVVGRFAGQLTVYDDSIVVQLDTLIATRRLPEDKQAVKFDSISVGVGVGDDKGWSPVDDSKALVIGRHLAKSGVIERHDVRFVLPHERTERDATSWIVVTFYITVGHPGDSAYSRFATTYAHSERGILAGP